MSLFSWKTLYAGDCAVILEFGDSIDHATVDQITSLNTLIENSIDNGNLSGVQETIPTFRSLAIVYDPLEVTAEHLLAQIKSLAQTRKNSRSSGNAQSHWEIPVSYGGKHGPDLSDVARLTGLSEQEVTRLHQSHTFTVYMLGFLPGFAFLGDTPPALHLPRKKEPRLRVPAGSVAIASQLTGIYPWESPGGWHILGNSPVPLFSAHHEPPALLKAGDQVHFRVIDDGEHVQICSRIKNGTFHQSELLRKPEYPHGSKEVAYKPEASATQANDPDYSE